jgi:hypothetical protein
VLWPQADQPEKASEIEGLFTVLIWAKWGCPITGCGQWVIGPWDLEWHTAAEHPGWTAPTSCW